MPNISRILNGISILALALSVLCGMAGSSMAQATMTVNTKNLPEVLKAMEKQTKPGMRINEYITLRAIKAQEKTFRMHYTIDTSKVALSASDITDADIRNERMSMCGQKNLKILMKHGAIFERIYEDSHNAVVYRVTANRQSCRKLGA